MLLQVILESQPEEFRVFFCKFECCYKNTFYYAILKLYYDKHDHKSILSVQNEIYNMYNMGRFATPPSYF